MYIVDSLLLLVSLVFLLLAINLFFPLKASKVSLLSFVGGILYGDLIWLWLSVQALVAVPYAFLVESPSDIAQLAGALLVVNWALLATHYFMGFATTKHFARAMAGIPITKKYPRFSRVFRWIPFGVDKIGLKIERDIAYGEQSLQKLDIYQCAVGKDSPSPVLLQIHGGGWLEKAGSKREQALPLIELMAKNGWIVVSIDYQLSPTVAMPEHAIDCKRALVWVKENIESYGGDPNFVVVTGGSAGGHLSSITALTENDPLLQPGFEEKDTSVQGCVTFYPVVDMINRNGLWYNNDLAKHLSKTVIQQKPGQAPGLYDQMSPLERVHKNAPPFLVIQGAADSLVAAREVPLFALRLDRMSAADSFYVELPFAQHAFDIFATPRSLLTAEAVLAFCDHLYQQKSGE